jgi:hypothetical protein
MESILVEVITPTLSNLEIGCFGCQTFMGLSGLRSKDRGVCAEDFPADLRERNERIVECINEVRSLYPDRIRIRVIDVLSPLGLWKLVRHGVCNLPVWIVDRQTSYSGADPSELGALIEERINEIRS